jgi:hypothetical protein
MVLFYADFRNENYPRAPMDDRMVDRPLPENTVQDLLLRMRSKIFF